MIEQAFESVYGRAPWWAARAPGRVNLIGEHTDYNEGFVLPMAVERYTEIAAAPNGSNFATLRSTAFDEIAQVDLNCLIEPEPDNSWTNYVKGVLAAFIKLGAKMPAFDALIHSTVPVGSGLSSSAALEVATATLLETITSLKLDPVQKAKLCREVEHEFAKVPCGIMDQYICSLAHQDQLLLLDCRSEEPQWIEFADPSVCLLVVQTNVRHQLTGGEYAIRRRQCEEAAKIMGVASLRDASLELLANAGVHMDRILERRVRHVVTENMRTLDAVSAIQKRDWPALGELMYASHRSLRTDFEVSCSELDAVVEIAHELGLEQGVFGCRMTGGGFGGCAIALIQEKSSTSVADIIATGYRIRTGIEAGFFISRPAGGVSSTSMIRRVPRDPAEPSRFCNVSPAAETQFQ